MINTIEDYLKNSIGIVTNEGLSIDKRLMVGKKFIVKEVSTPTGIETASIHTILKCDLDGEDYTVRFTTPHMYYNFSYIYDLKYCLYGKGVVGTDFKSIGVCWIKFE